MSGRVVHVNDDIEGAVYIGRAVPRKGIKASLLANPIKVGSERTREQAINIYRNSIWLLLMNALQPAKDKQALVEAIIELRGKPLACWCRHDGEPKTDENACHGDVLLELLDQYTDEQLREMAR